MTDRETTERLHLKEFTATKPPYQGMAVGAFFCGVFLGTILTLVILEMAH